MYSAGPAESLGGLHYFETLYGLEFTIHTPDIYFLISLFLRASLYLPRAGLLSCSHIFMDDDSKKVSNSLLSGRFLDL